MGSGYWHPPMNPKEIDPSSVILGSPLMLSPTLNGRERLGVRGQVGGVSPCRRVWDSPILCLRKNLLRSWFLNLYPSLGLPSLGGLSFCSMVTGPWEG